MGKQTYRIMCYATALLLLLLNNRLMIFEIRSGVGVDPHQAAWLGAVMGFVALAAMKAAP
jgi:hypothetical protein